MKYAPLVAGSALGLLLVAFAIASPFTPLRKVVALDFTGVDTLEIRGNTPPQILISSRLAPQASYTDEQNSKFNALRGGNRLVITVKSDSYLMDLQIRVPASLRSMEVHGANILTKERLQSMQVSSSNGVTWEGDIARLDLRDTTDHTHHDDPKCGCSATSFNVADGHIAELLVRSPHGILRLSKPDKIDAAYAWLGEKGGVSLEEARRFDNIHLLSSEAQLPDVEGATPTSP